MKKIIPPAFWEHTLPGAASCLVRFKVAITYFISSGFVCLGIGILIIAVMQSAWEVSKDYTLADLDKQLEINVPEDTSTVHLYIGAREFHSNYRTFVSSKDPDVASTSFQPTDCTGAETIKDLVFIRGMDFIMNPPTRYVNEDGFFNLTDPVFDSSLGADNRTSIEEKDVIRYKTDSTSQWVKVEVSSANVEAMRKLTATRIERGAALPRPCGLTSFSMPLEWFELRDDQQQLVALDESSLAREVDISFVKSQKTKTLKGLHFLTPDSPTTDGNVDIGNVTSWLKGNSATTTANNRDAAFMRLLAWNRNSASPSLRFMVGTYSNLKRGTYTLTPKDVDKAWTSWGIKREAVLAKLSPVGTNFAFIPALCIVIGVAQLIFAVVFYILLKKQKDT
eukprot:GEMP01008106.1.p1 GENE.GEMP01008106.1~~GEMP01008106.1.p1  ORF type:complete len:393 (+),score=52.02 GEMP01008106.1:729-1907(+)